MCVCVWYLFQVMFSIFAIRKLFKVRRDSLFAYDFVMRQYFRLFVYISQMNRFRFDKFSTNFRFETMTFFFNCLNFYRPNENIVTRPANRSHPVMFRIVPIVWSMHRRRCRYLQSRISLQQQQY